VTDAVTVVTLLAAAVLAWRFITLRRCVYKQSVQIDELNDSLQGLLAAAQALPDGVVSLDENLCITACNRAAASHLAVSMDACQGRDVVTLLAAPAFTDYAHARDWREPVLVRVSPESDTHTNAESRLLMLRLVPYGRSRRLLISRDVTQLDKLETTRRDFVANVSHELRTPLTVLAGFLETLRDLPQDAVSNEQRDQYMTMMYEQAQRMQAIVADLLTLSTLESSPGSAPAPVNMLALIDTARTQAETLSDARHEFVWNIDAQLDVLGSDAELASAIANLLGNAVHYTPAGGRITVCWQCEPDGSACYSVSDTGIGIAAQHLPRLTERFYRVDRSRSRAAGGTGLGLAITKHVAMRHEAELDITSQPGQGSTFTLRFPAARVLGVIAQNRPVQNARL